MKTKQEIFEEAKSLLLEYFKSNDDLLKDAIVVELFLLSKEWGRAR